MTDSTDDFQFKPLTEGLGFHRKNQAKKQTVLNTDIGDLKPASPRKLAELDSTLAQIGTELGLDPSEMVELTPTLPRRAPETPKTHLNVTPANSTIAARTTTPVANAPANTTVDDILKTLHEKRKQEFGDRTISRNRVSNEALPATYKSSAFEFSAGLLDLMLIMAANLLCLITLLVVTKVDLFANLFNPDAQGMIFMSLLIMFAGVSWIYLVVNRTFLGYTAGEWVFDQRLGKPEEAKKTSYGFKVAVRSAIVIATGFVLFPLVSALMNQDVLGRMMGLELVKKA